MSEETPETSGDDASPGEVADRIEALAHGWRASNEGALARMEAALPGFVGTAAEALRDLIPRLQNHDDQIHARMMHSADVLRGSGKLPERQTPPDPERPDGTPQ
ncbi:hypothetical protein [Mycobacteroides abscessus]|uniref:hypothetical protein n=1 Tax=Mycobacteroides abscessus TaxID=36809 RepID=UPI0013000E21|nr:hypothetical protein [Mycobacteroides abscessus]